MSAPAVIHVVQADTLDHLWHEARGLGIINVDMDWKGELYTVSIKFHRKSGTRIDAKGSNTNIAFALATAINEARAMGAGEPQ
jgi:hypothetical protein